MSVAQTRHVLQTIAVQTADHRQPVVIAAGAVAVAALSLAVRYGGLAQAALLIALAAVSAATALWFRLRGVERSHAALTSTVADLTTRLDLLLDAAPPVPTIQVPPDTSLGDYATSETATADAGPTGDPSDPAATDVSPLQAPAEPRPLQRVSDAGEPERGWGRGPAPATEQLPLQPNPATDNGQLPAPLGAETDELDETSDSDALAPPSELITAKADDTPPSVPESMPAFSLTALNGEVVTDGALIGTPAVVVFWRPGCQHCQRLTPELVAWQSLQGPRLVVFAACDGPTAFRAGLPGLVILDPGFTVGQALGAPGTPAALPLDAAGRPSGPVVAGASAVTTLLLDAMRDWASVEPGPLPALPAPDVEGAESAEAALESASADDPEPGRSEAVNEIAPPTVLLRRIEEIPSKTVEGAPDWDVEADTRRAG